jgi:2-aminoethylphosphonate-pyruvate transaminase
VLLSGSGTAALEAAVTSCVSAEGRMLVVDNGVYGDRIAKMAEASRIPYDRITAGWTEQPDLDAVESALATGRYEVLAAVHHETTTGLLNPVTDLVAIAHRHGALMVLDSISGLAGETVDPAGPDLVVCTANKCVQGLPGLSFVLASREALARMVTYPARSLYLNLPNAYQHQEKRSTPFTPAVQVGFALREALLELREETVPGRIARYRRASDILRAGFRELGLSLLLPDALLSNTITTLRMPAGATYDLLHDGLKERGYVIYAGQGPLAREAFRVANMGLISEDALHAFQHHLRDVLARV